LNNYYVKDVPTMDIVDLEYLSKNGKDNFRKAIAKREDCPIHILEHLANDEIAYVRAAVAGNVNCPVSLLIQLAYDKYDCYCQNCVRSNVAMHEKCPIDILEMLSKDYSLSYAVLCNVNCPEYILDNLSKIDNCHIKTKVIAHEKCTNKIIDSVLIYLKDRDFIQTEFYLRNPKCPYRFLREIYKNKELNSRYLEIIKTHPNWKVVDFE